MHLCDNWTEVVEPMRINHPWMNHVLNFVRDHGQPNIEISVHSGGYNGLPTAHYGDMAYAQLNWRWSPSCQRNILAWWYGDSEWDHVGPVIKFGPAQY